MRATDPGRRVIAILPLLMTVWAPHADAQAPPTGSTGLLNRLNPEISATADVLMLYVPTAEHGDEHAEHAAHEGEEHGHAAVIGEGDEGFRFVPREVELDLRANIDPFSAFRTTLGFSPSGVELEEAWFEWVGVLPHLNLKVGRFRQSLGPINRWHLHAWDQMELPLAMKTLLGDEGLAQTGLSLAVLFGGFGDWAHTFALEVTNSESEELFGDDAWRLPATLAHFATHVPFSDAGYMEIGLGAQHGYHAGSPNRFTNVYSADLTLAYDPPGGPDRFRMFVRSQWLATHVEGDDDTLTLNQGAFTYVDFRFDRRWQAGVGGDWVENDTTWGITPYLAFWQSEYFRLRLQYRATLTSHATNHLVALQLTGAIGPHRHERY